MFPFYQLFFSWYSFVLCVWLVVLLFCPFFPYYIFSIKCLFFLTIFSFNFFQSIFVHFIFIYKSSTWLSCHLSISLFCPSSFHFIFFQHSSHCFHLPLFSSIFVFVYHLFNFFPTIFLPFIPSNFTLFSSPFLHTFFHTHSISPLFPFF